MRLSAEHIAAIKSETASEFGAAARVRLFGSRIDDERKGGDVDLLVESQSPVEDAALRAARLSTRISRRMHGRKVDVVVAAPNLMRLPIHAVAEAEGIVL